MEDYGNAKTEDTYRNQSIGGKSSIAQDDRSMLSQAASRIAQCTELLQANLENLYRLANKSFGSVPEAPSDRAVGGLTSFGGEAGTLFEQINRLEGALGDMPSIVSRYARVLD